MKDPVYSEEVEIVTEPIRWWHKVLAILLFMLLLISPTFAVELERVGQFGSDNQVYVLRDKEMTCVIIDGYSTTTNDKLVPVAVSCVPKHAKPPELKKPVKVDTISYNDWIEDLEHDRD